MKIRHIYQTITPIVENTTPDDSIQSIYTEYAALKLFSKLEEMMRGNPEKEIAEDDIARLKILFKDYFAVVMKTDAVSLHDPKSNLTAVYLTLAQELESITGISRYQFMLPEVNVVEYEASLMSLHDRDLQLTDLLLSDDDTFVIEVMASLDSAIEDGKLRHTRLFDGQEKMLSESETNRVINHSSEAKAYWDAIQEKVNIELHGESYGAVLKRLANNLIKGGAHGSRGGSEFNSGADANAGIQAFFEWFDFLEKEEHDAIFAVNASGLSYTLGERLDRLRRPSDADYTDTLFCVELIGGNIETILRFNSQLFDIYPINKSAAASIGINQIKARLTSARDALKNAMNSPQYKVLSRYPDSNENFARKVCNLTDLTEILGDKFKNYIKTTHAIYFFLTRIEINNRYKFLCDIKDILQKIWKPYLDKGIIPMLPNDEQKIGVAKIFAKQICELIDDLDALKEIVAYYPSEHITTLIQILFAENPDLFRNDIDILAYINTVSNGHYIENANDLLRMLAHIPEDCRFEFCCRHQDKITTIEKFFKLFNSFSENGKKELVNYYPHQALLKILSPSCIDRDDFVKYFRKAVLCSERSITDFFLNIFGDGSEENVKQIILLLRIPHIANKLDKKGLIAIGQINKLIEQEIISYPLLLMKIKCKVPEDRNADRRGFFDRLNDETTSELMGSVRTYQSYIASKISESRNTGNVQFFFNPQRDDINSAMRATVNALQNYGVTESFIRQHWQPATRGIPHACWSINHHFTLIYLVTGQPSSFMRQTCRLPAENCLSPIDALSEMAGLCGDRLCLLKKLYTIGLRGEHLRALHGMGDEILSLGHCYALKHLIRGGLPILEAVGRVNEMTEDEAWCIKHPNRFSNQRGIL